MDFDTTTPTPSCKDCMHFFVTYDARFPYGCRSMGFKSRRYPCLEVQEATGQRCQGREARRVPGAKPDLTDIE
jgi:hypothetical protein